MMNKVERAETLETGPGGRSPWAPTFNGQRLNLTLAMSDYDHVRDLMDGEVRPEGLSLLPLKLPVEEIFFRTIKFREWEVSEMSLAKYVSLLSQGDLSLTAIPVFPSRLFRHSSIYVRADGPVREPADLAGRRVGLPEWAQTAAIYSRGFLAHQFGLRLDSIEWIQAGVNEPGRMEKVALKLPPNIRLTPRPDRTLDEMLLSGDLDAVLTAHPPKAFKDGNPAIRRLFSDHREVEQSYHSTTGVFPIMHTVAIRRDVLDRFPWVAMSLFKGFQEAKKRSLNRLAEMTASRFPLPWIQSAASEASSRFGSDIWPYGLDANRPTLDAFLAYAFEQGVCHRRLTVGELFAPETTVAFRI